MGTLDSLPNRWYDPPVLIDRILSASRTVFHRGKQHLRPPSALRNLLTSTGHERQLLAQLHSCGFAVIENFVSSDQCRSLIAKVDRIFHVCARSLWRSEDGADVRAFAAETASEEIARYNSEPFLRRLAERYLGLPQVAFFTLANRIRPTPANLGSGGGWHRDSAAEHQFKSLLYLTDVGPENGPFEFVPNSHQLRSIVRTILRTGTGFGQHRFPDETVERVCRELAVTPRSFTATAGTLIVADTSGIHRGMPINSGERYVLTNYFFTPKQIDACWSNGKFVKNFVGQKARATS